MKPVESLIFAIIFLVAMVVFIRRIYTLINLISLGNWEYRFDRLWERFKNMVFYGFLQKKVLKKTFGFNHFMLFWGFMVLLPINLEFVLSGFFPKFSLSFIGEFPYKLLNMLADIMSAVVMIAVIFAVLRRVVIKPSYLESTKEAYIILSTVGFLMAAYFGMNITAIDPKEKDLILPVSEFLRTMIISGMKDSELYILNRIFWWVHASLFLFFLIFIPYSKHLHIITSLPNCFFRNFSFPTSPSKMQFSKNMSFGISKITDFSWKDLLDALSCTECGRCKASCPANISGKTLNPKEFIHTLKKNLMENGLYIISNRPFDTIGKPMPVLNYPVPLIGNGEGSINEESIWDCTTCGACVEVCPVFIEHFPKILNIRRNLVMEEVRFPEELITFFENIEARSNPWGIAPSERGKWAQHLDIPIFSKNENHEYLLYVGCMGSFDARTKKIINSLVTVLNTASVSYGILGSDEMCCGDALRRLGNEYVFDSIAIKNVNLFKKLNVKNVITICPHCYNTLKNDYRAYGAEFNVFHHTELLNMLYKNQVLKRDFAFGEKSIVYHDSCYLARYNSIIEEPRYVLKSFTGKLPLEMGNSKKDTFCCGAGGGRMWLEDDAATRINRERTKEALLKKPNIIATSCPYCVTMFEDGLKELNVNENIQVLDICELIVEGLKIVKDTEKEKIIEEKRRVANG
ncbi:MAG: (Fe-S)-binding protein [Syntrophorhabdaceae bacterium]|nr:(Fe-S)-binding protein [Syntrophorhabdaceae bacterium]